MNGSGRKSELSDAGICFDYTGVVFDVTACAVVGYSSVFEDAYHVEILQGHMRVLLDEQHGYL